MASLKCMNRQVTHQVSSSVLPSNSSLGGATLAGLRRLLLVQFLTIVHRKRFPTALRQVYQGVVEQDHLSCKLEAKALQAVLVAAACSGGIQAGGSQCRDPRRQICPNQHPRMGQAWSPTGDTLDQVSRSSSGRMQRSTESPRPPRATRQGSRGVHATSTLCTIDLRGRQRHPCSL